MSLRVALMQPYFFPYIGYFALMAAVDVFVFYDIAQYSRPGWINRNRILRDGAPEWWTATVADAPHKSPIAAREYRDWPRQRVSLLDRLAQRYRRAPHWRSGSVVVADALAGDEANVARRNIALVSAITAACGLACRVRVASDLAGDGDTRGEARVIELMVASGATTYVNAPGGMALYSPQAFEARGMALRFVRPAPDPYVQFDAPFVPSLSIVDALMFLPIEEVARRMRQFTLVEKAP